VDAWGQADLDDVSHQALVDTQWLVGLLSMPRPAKEMTVCGMA
jgi:hypothetical protein